MLYNFATDSISEYSLGMWYLAIYMTPHLKQQERNNGVWGLGCGGGGAVTNIFVIYLGESRIFFQRDWGGGVVKCFAHHMKM